MRYQHKVLTGGEIPVERAADKTARFSTTTVTKTGVSQAWTRQPINGLLIDAHDSGIGENKQTILPISRFSQGLVAR